MLEINKIHCGETVDTMKLMGDKSINLIVTSPPYRASVRKDNHKYPDAIDVVDDNQTEEEYINWMVNIFKQYERILKDDGVVAFNISYTTFAPYLPYHVISEVFKNTSFTIADTLAWKKNSCVPLSGHPTRMTRICEPVYIFVKKDFLETYSANKVVRSISDTGQKYFTAYYNFLEAKNNDGKIAGHEATYSSEFAEFFIDLYSKPGDLVLDNFMGTGTTGVACKNLDRNFIGIDIFPKYIEAAEERIKNNIPANDIIVDFFDKDAGETMHQKVYYKNIPRVGEDWLMGSILRRVMSVNKVGSKWTVNVESLKIDEVTKDRYSDYYDPYIKWVNNKDISDPQKIMFSNDLTYFMRFVKKCKKNKDVLEKIKELS